MLTFRRQPSRGHDSPSTHLDPCWPKGCDSARAAFLLPRRHPVGSGAFAGPSRGLRRTSLVPSLPLFSPPSSLLSSASPRLSHRPAPAVARVRAPRRASFREAARAESSGIHVPNSDAIGGCPRPPLPPLPPIRPSCCVVSKITPSGSSVEEGVEMLYSLGGRDWAPAPYSGTRTAPIVCR